jgi:hypothetical protein
MYAEKDKQENAVKNNILSCFTHWLPLFFFEPVGRYVVFRPRLAPLVISHCAGGDYHIRAGKSMSWYMQRLDGGLFWLFNRNLCFIAGSAINDDKKKTLL